MEDAREILWYIAENFQGCGIGSDIITGFPGESRKELEEGMEEFLSLPISYLHVFPYSEREGTGATRLDQIIPIDERKRRAARWRTIAERKKLNFLNSLVGKKLKVVVEDRRYDDSSIAGTSSEYADVRILPSKIESKMKTNLKAGQLAEVRAIELLSEGSLVCESLNQVS